MYMSCLTYLCMAYAAFLLSAHETIPLIQVLCPLGFVDYVKEEGVYSILYHVYVLIMQTPTQL